MLAHAYLWKEALGECWIMLTFGKRILVSACSRLPLEKGSWSVLAHAYLWKEALGECLKRDGFRGGGVRPLGTH